ncbi:MAG: transcription antitermination factor NusB [Peptococcia bacterium]
MGRRLARELAMKSLFARDLGKNETGEILARLVQEYHVADEVKAFGEKLINGVVENQQYLDTVIDQYAIEWQLERIAPVERNILRIALYEMICADDTPPAVVINEALEVAKIYGGDDSPRFLNGILGKVLKELPKHQAARDD